MGEDEKNRGLDFGIIIAGHIVVDAIIDQPGQTIPRKALGGAPSYSSIALASLGYKPEIVTHVGEDLPDEYARIIKDKTGINVYRWVSPGFKTTSYRIDRSGEHRRLWLAARCRELSIGDFGAYLTDPSVSRALVLNPVAGEISLPLLERISKEFEYVCVDSQGFVRRFDKKTGEVGMRSGLDISSLAGVDVLKADQEELGAWSGMSNKDSAISQLSKFVNTLLVTSGPSHVEVYERGELRLRASPFNVKVADTTGAGDIMLSSFAARFTETGDLERALAFAVTASTLAVRNYGIQKAVLSKPEVETESLRVQIQFEK